MKPFLNKKTDILIPLGSGSKWENNELRYSLRSIEKYVRNVGEIYIVGLKPNWLKNVIHVPFNDVHNGNPRLRNQNILQKILHTILEYPISENFVFTNDDIFFNREFSADKIPYFSDMNIDDYLQSKPHLNRIYKSAVLRTKALLLEHNKTLYHYDIHAPIIYNKQRFFEIFKDIKDEIIIKSYYSNFCPEIKPKLLEDNKIFKPLSLHEIQTANKYNPFMSLTDIALNDIMKKYILNKYNKNSNYE